MDQTRRQAPPTTSTRVPSKSILSHSPMFHCLKFLMPKSRIDLPGGEASYNFQPHPAVQLTARGKPCAPSSVLMLQSWWNCVSGGLDQASPLVTHGEMRRALHFQTFVESGVQTLHMKWEALGGCVITPWRSYDLICARLSWHVPCVPCECTNYKLIMYMLPLGEIAQQKSDSM